MADDEFNSTEELKKTAEQEYEERLKNIGGVNAAAAKMQAGIEDRICLLYTSPSPRDRTRSRMPSSA